MLTVTSFYEGLIYSRGGEGSVEVRVGVKLLYSVCPEQ